MKKALVALVCTFGAVACGENKPAENPSTPATTSYTTTETSTTVSDPSSRTSAPPATPSTPSVGSTSTTGSTGDTGSTGAAMPQSTTPAPAPADTSRTAAPPVGATAAANPGSADNTKDATNTKVNDRDRHGALTPMDQGGGKDRDITAAIRRAVVSDGSLSFNAKNVKIITVAGKVTLRGPVKSDAERATIESKAKSAAGVTEVDNQLEVKK